MPFKLARDGGVDDDWPGDLFWPPIRDAIVEYNYVITFTVKTLVFSAIRIGFGSRFQQIKQSKEDEAHT